MTARKHNRSSTKIGKRRGMSIRLARGIARKFGLTHLVIYTIDDLQRSRIVYFAKNDQAAAQCAHFATGLSAALGWETIFDFDCSSVRRMKQRITQLETALAQIVDGSPDAIGIARAAGKFPDESDGEKTAGAWLWFPGGKHNPDVRRCPRCRYSLE